jgi:8-oxo-dGTP pyrophosphatase MutT (NUDIX family)
MEYSQDLRELLEAYAPSDARETLFRARMLELADTPRPFDRSSFEPGHFTASAFIISPERDALLLVHHKKLGLWLQPGGHIDPSDASALEAARREVMEEVGVRELRLASHDRALFDIDIHPIPAHGREPAHEHFDLRFLFVAEHRGFSASEEVAAARWVPLGELDAITQDASVRRATGKIR